MPWAPVSTSLPLNRNYTTGIYTSIVSYIHSFISIMFIRKRHISFIAMLIMQPKQWSLQWVSNKHEDRGDVMEISACNGPNSQRLHGWSLVMDQFCGVTQHDRPSVYRVQGQHAYTPYQIWLHVLCLIMKHHPSCFHTSTSTKNPAENRVVMLPTLYSTWGCHKGNLRSHQCRQSWQHDNVKCQCIRH